METSSKRLDKILNEISTIYIDSHQSSKTPTQLSKKLQNYTKGTLLIDEAVQLIEKLQEEIKNMDTTKADKSHSSKINQYIDLLSISNQKFDNVLNLVEQFRGICSGIPNSTEIFDNIDQEVIYEEQEILEN
jgi:hypothetical protein